MSVAKRVRGWCPADSGLCVVVGVLLVALALASCSANATRFDYPLFSSNDQAKNEQLTTASIKPVPAEPVYYAPRESESAVVKNELPPPAPTAQPAPVRTAARTPPRPAPMPLPPAAKKAPPPEPKKVTVQVKRGDTLSAIAREHNVTVDELMSANGLKSTNLSVGQTLVVPGRSAPPARTTAKYSVRRGDTLSSIARQHDIDYHDLAEHNSLKTNTVLQVGQVLKIPGQGPAPARPVKVAAKRDAMPVPAANPVRETPRPAPPSAERRPAAKPAKRVAKLPPPQPMISTKFRWPVRGRVISGFGPKPDGKHNDGINVAVPLGTSIKAAENGVIAYAGDELEGYGKLILIRHADNWVTAYAHTDEILVKRGDEVRRGQIIAKAGKTGAVSQPQLHFELRRGSQPVDPLKYMAES